MTSMSDGATVFQVSPAGVVTTLVNSSKAEATLKLLEFHQFFPWGMAYDAAGNLYISDFGHAAVYKLTKMGAMSVFAGSPGREGDVDGSVGFATLGYYTIDSMTIDDGGNLYLSGQGRLRKVSPAG
ncbi:MAG: repeat family protein, partial [Massilia sp.]|nr:repeat family protein [Massilia sp.]